MTNDPCSPVPVRWPVWMSRPSASWLLLLAAGALVLPACIQGTDGNGQRSTELRAVSGFTRVESRGSLDVQLDQGPAFTTTVSIDSNLQRHVETRVEGTSLIIDVAGAIGDTVPGPHVLVTLPVLERATITGSGRITTTDFQQDQPVALDLDGSGDIVFTGTVPSVEGHLGGSGTVRISGAATSIDLSLDGSGTIDAAACRATDAAVSLSGSGRVATTATTTARVSLSGSGDVDLYGGATLTALSVSGSGGVHTH